MLGTIEPVLASGWCRLSAVGTTESCMLLCRLARLQGGKGVIHDV